MADFDTKTEHQDAPPNGPTHHASGTSTSSQNTGQGIHEAKPKAREVVDKAQAQAKSMLDEQKRAAAGQAEGLAKAMRKMAEQLNTQDQSPIAHYVERAADSLDSLGGNLRDRDLDSLAHQVQDLARQKPGLFIGGAVAAGFMVARFLKSSADRPHPGVPRSAQISTGGSPYPDAGSTTESIDTPAESESIPTPT